MTQIITIILLLSSSLAYSIEKPVVAVFPFNSTGVNQTTANLTSDFLRRELIKLGRMTIVERDQMETILKAQGENLDECTEEGCAIRMGEMLDMEMIVVGEVVKSFSRFVVSARLIDLTTRKIVLGGSITRDNIKEEQVTDDMPELAWQLVGNLKLNAHIARINGNQIYMNVGTGLVKTGQRLIIKRKGEAITDPNSGELLGYIESEIGEVEVVNVLSDNLSMCKVVRDEGFKLGDFADLGGVVESAPVIQEKATTYSKTLDKEIASPAERLRNDNENVIARNEETKQSLKKISGQLKGMEFVLIPADSFQMDWDYQVSFSSFYMMTTEVTQKMWKEVMGKNPSNFKGEYLPVERVSWDDIQDFIKKLNQRDTGKDYRLPSEAEWEYACRAGTTTRYHSGNGKSNLDRVGWYRGNSGSKTHPVGQKVPNGFGLYDMHGNVWEWCQDWFGIYPSSSITDPRGPLTGSYRVARGGRLEYHLRVLLIG